MNIAETLMQADLPLAFVVLLIVSVVIAALLLLYILLEVRRERLARAERAPRLHTTTSRSAPSS
jgi:Flp pilus assembly protein protease CpaA